MSLPVKTLGAGHAARAFIDTWLAGWGLHHRIDDVQLVLSELIGNVLRHTNSTAVTVLLDLDPEFLLMEVRDYGEALAPGEPDNDPNPTEAPEDAEGGRGMCVIRSLCTYYARLTREHPGDTRVVKMALT